MILHGAKTYFSVGESIVSPKQLIEEAAKQGYKVVSVADTNNVNALPELTKYGKEHDIKVVIGASLDVVDDLAWRRPAANEKKTKDTFWRTNVYVKNEQGFKELMALITLANDPDHFYFKPRICLNDLIETMKKGNVYSTSGTLYSLFSHDNYDAVLNRLRHAGVDSEFVLELLPYDSLYCKRVCSRVLARSHENKVLAQPCLHLKEQRELRNVMNCVTSNTKMDSPFRQELMADFHMLDESEYESAERCLLFNFLKEMMDQCTFEWNKQDITLPRLYAKPFEALRDLCVDGFKKRLLTPTLGYKPTDFEPYKKRLAYELGVLKSMGFEDYFLLVHHIVQWCKTQRIEVGPGRGSVGGSLVAYLTGITDVDPIRFGLYFERFINPDRLDLPDIDLDFMSSRRGEVIEHLIDKFGEDKVAGISNYSMLGSSSSLRAVAKANGLQEHEYECSKFIPKLHGNSLSLEEAATEVAEIEKFAIAHPSIFAQASHLQGTFRNYGKHAAGVIVAGEPVANRAVLTNQSEFNTVNWDKRHVEDFGFVKLDILGLTTLDVLSLALEYVEERTGDRIELSSIPLDYEDVMENFRCGNTVGVFQFESGGMRNLLKQLGEIDPLSFSDVSAATALYRPGPMDSGLMDEFIQIKQGNAEPSYVHDNMQAALEETYGVMVYQEQVMQLARDLAGFSMSESDHLRKAMGKKDPEAMAKQRDKWTDGCEAHSDLDRAVAERLFDQIESFAGYAFNKSHAIEYTIISYWAMYFKVRYPAEFFAATMTVLPSLKIAKDAQKNDIIILPPDINKSSDRFEIREEKGRTVLYTPFQLIKGLSAKASEAILNAKRTIGRDFTSKQEFIDTVVRRTCNIRVQERLDQVGAFAEIEPGQIPATHPDRLRDQKQLLPDTTISSVKADRKCITDAEAKSALSAMHNACHSCGRCTLSGEPHPQPRLGRSAKIMIVTDCPSYSEGRAGRMTEGDDVLKNALREADISLSDIYVTSLVKAPKPKGEQLTNEMINGCSGFLEAEIDALKPPVIVTLGGKITRHLLPELKGGWEELAGTEVYDSKRDASIIVGMNPAMLHFKPQKTEVLVSALQQARHLIE